MSLRFKTILLVGLTLTVLILVTAEASSLLYSSFLLRTEEHDTLRQVQIALDAINDEADKLAFTTQDYASWDDAYQFVQDGNVEFRDSNLATPVITRLRLSQIVYVQASGRVVHAGAAEKPSDVPFLLPGLEQHLTPDDVLLSRPLQGQGVTGLLLLDDGPVLVSAQPVLTSKNEGPIHGVLLMMRDLDAQLLSRIGDRLNAPMTAWRLDRPVPAAQTRVAEKIVTSPDARAVEPLDDRDVAGYARIDDLERQPALLLQVGVHRDIFRQGQSSLRLQTLVSVIIGLSLTIVVLIMMARLVLTPLARLSRGVEQIGTSGDGAMRLAVAGKDELARLARSINEMLDALERTRAHAVQLEQHAEQLEQHAEQLEQQVQRLHIQIDEAKKERDVAEITETSYFHYLQGRAREMRTRRSATPAPPAG